MITSWWQSDELKLFQWSCCWWNEKTGQPPLTLSDRYTNISPLLCCRVQPWPSSWGLRRTWSAQPSHQRRASTAFSAPQLWPASTSFSLWPSPAPTAASPNASSTCPAAPSCSLPPSRRRRPRAAQSCEQWGCPPHPRELLPPPCFSPGKGGGFNDVHVAEGFVRESFLTPRQHAFQNKWTLCCPLCPDLYTSAYLSYTVQYLAFLDRGLIISRHPFILYRAKRICGPT